MFRLIILLIIGGISGCSDGDGVKPYHGAGYRPPAEVPEIVWQARSLLENKYPEAAGYRTVMGGSPNAYARYHFDRQEIELTSLWVELAHKDLRKGACVIAHEYGHSLGYDQGQATQYEHECLKTI